MVEEVIKRAHVYVSGIVQGVFFRSTTRDMAQNLGLKGWVRNLPDGRVEAVFEGPKHLVEKAIQWCHQGPPGAVVESVEVSWEEPKGERDFRILY